MPENPSNPQQIREFVRERRDAFRFIREELACDVALNCAYYEGLQWLYTRGQMGSRKIGRVLTDYTPDAKKLRVTANVITTHTIKAISTTFPNEIECNCFPMEHDLDTSSLTRAGTLETLLNCAIGRAGYLAARQKVNELRSIMGAAVVGLALDRRMVRVETPSGAVTVPDIRVRAFAADPTRLTLDTSVESRNLLDHEDVIYSQPMSGRAIQRRYGIQLKDEQMRPLGDIARYETQLAEITNGRLYSSYASCSKVPGAMVHQAHLKDDAGRFGRMFIVIEVAEGEWLVHGDSDESPFGGEGLPLALFTAHPRTNGVFGIGDVAMQRGAQDLRNLAKSQYFRQVQRAMGHQILVDRKAFGENVADETIANKVHNGVGGLIIWQSGRREQNIQPPQPIFINPPDRSILDAGELESNQARENVFRAEVNFGRTKSHVPNATYNLAVDEADQVLGVRVKGDIENDLRLLPVLLGTEVDAVRGGGPGAINYARRLGFGPEELAVVAQTDPADPPVRIKVRESSIRYRSHASRKQDLDLALERQTLSPERYRMTLAEDLDAPAVEEDRRMALEAARWAMRIIAGATWEPIPLGEYSAFFIAAFRRAMLDKAALSDPEARQRLREAIMLQQQAQIEEAMASDPQAVLQREQMAAQQEQAAQQAAAAPAGPEPQGPATLQDAIAQAMGQAPQAA
jgi:hypothetical protein